MNIFKRFIIKLAASYVRQPVLDYFAEINWENDDSTALNDYLRTDSGKKLIKAMAWNSVKVASEVTKVAKPDLADIKAESKAWKSMARMLVMLSASKKEIADRKLTETRLEDMFAKMVNNNSRINSNAIYGKS